MDNESMMNFGIDYEKGLKNCMGNPQLFNRILSMFLNDKCFARAKAAYENGDLHEMFNALHELKGISGSAALVELYDASTPLVELLRDEGCDKKEVSELFSAVEKTYSRAYQGISKYLEQS